MKILEKKIQFWLHFHETHNTVIQLRNKNGQSNCSFLIKRSNRLFVHYACRGGITRNFLFPPQGNAGDVGDRGASGVAGKQARLGLHQLLSFCSKYIMFCPLFIGSIGHTRNKRQLWEYWSRGMCDILKEI